MFKIITVGEDLHGMVFPPVGLEPGKQYPTILYVYGGPQIQVCANYGHEWSNTLGYIYPLLYYF